MPIDDGVIRLTCDSCEASVELWAVARHDGYQPFLYVFGWHSLGWRIEEAGNGEFIVVCPNCVSPIGPKLFVPEE